jgi:hypothetical protein
MDVSLACDANPAILPHRMISARGCRVAGTANGFAMPVWQNYAGTSPS